MTLQVFCYENFIPFSEDFSDLVDKIEWAKQNSSSVAKMITNANSIALDIFQYEHVLGYFYKALVRASSYYPSFKKLEEESTAKAANICNNR